MFKEIKDKIKEKSYKTGYALAKKVHNLATTIDIESGKIQKEYIDEKLEEQRKEAKKHREYWENLDWPPSRI